MAEKKVKKAATSRKRKITTNVDKGRVYIQSSFNNTIVTVTDAAGNALAACSAGALGYKGSKKMGTQIQSRIGASRNIGNKISFFQNVFWRLESI
jgi:ribosomal protein S11